MDPLSPAPVVGYERRVKACPTARFTAIEETKPVSVIAVEDHPVYLITAVKEPSSGPA